MASDPLAPKGTLGGSNRMLSARDVAAILAIPERTVRDKWKEWGLPAYRIGNTSDGENATCTPGSNAKPRNASTDLPRLPPLLETATGA